MFTTLAVMLFGFLLGAYAKRLVTLYQCVAECLATPLPDTRMLPINPDGPLPQWTRMGIERTYSDLAKYLKANHFVVNGCLTTDYQNIGGLKVLASTTNGTSGIGRYLGYKVYWAYDYQTKTFKVERG